MWDAAATLDVITTIFSDTGTLLALVIGTLVTAIVSLLGLGFAMRKTIHYVFGARRYQDVMGTSYATREEAEGANAFIRREGL